ncbi:MAG TPA: 50S ribosomal protein L18 [Candidatus Nanoarchaeia archaeon]|nr:50S ribosomal protein L18 [Candidatus Nanoarchaeia archaeon]
MRTIRRRRLEAKTDYKTRLALLKSGIPRFVVRKTNTSVIAQVIIATQGQDKIVAGASSSLLLTKGWPEALRGSLKSLPAAYLTGHMVGKAALKHTKKAILDIGMQRNIHKSRLYALVAGAIDAGLVIPCDKEALPSKEHITKNTKLQKAFEAVKGKL